MCYNIYSLLYSKYIVVFLTTYSLISLLQLASMFIKYKKNVEVLFFCFSTEDISAHVVQVFLNSSRSLLCINIPNT